MAYLELIISEKEVWQAPVVCPGESVPSLPCFSRCALKVVTLEGHSNPMNKNVMFVSLVYISPILREINRFCYLPISVISCIFL